MGIALLIALLLIRVILLRLVIARRLLHLQLLDADPLRLEHGFQLAEAVADRSETTECRSPHAGV